MANKLILTRRAEEDIFTATAYYDEIDTALGDKFATTLRVIFEKIAAHPQYYSFVSSSRKSNLRDIKIPVFPYLVIFEIRDETVLVISVKNTAKEK